MPKIKYNINNSLIRKADIDDVSNLLKIEKESYGKHHWSEEGFINEFSNPYSNYFVFVEKIPKRIVGYIGYWKVKEEGHITTLVVDKDFRRCGVADILLYFLIHHAIKNNIISLTLEVRASNTPALSLYIKNGFKELGIRKKYYQDNNEDALILWLYNLSDNLSLVDNKVWADILQYISMP